MKPLLMIDLYCNAGGASAGYARAGFEVIGVDIEPQPRYPYTFVQADALVILRDLIDGRWGVRLCDVTALHASPPCQGRSRATPDRSKHPALIGPTRELLQQTGKPWVIENVPPAPGTEPLRPDLILCGCMFPELGGRLRRERWFETEPRLFAMRPSCVHVKQAVSVLRHGARVERSRRHGSHHEHVPHAEAERLMGIDWMTQTELGEAIPPQYAQYVGELLLAEIERAA